MQRIATVTKMKTTIGREVDISRLTFSLLAIAYSRFASVFSCARAANEQASKVICIACPGRSDDPTTAMLLFFSTISDLIFFALFHLLIYGIEGCLIHRGRQFSGCSGPDGDAFEMKLSSWLRSPPAT